MPSSTPVVINQLPPAPYATSSAAPNSDTSSTFRSNTSRSTYISSTSSSTSGYVSVPPAHTSATRTPEVIAMTSNGQREFVYTGRPQGGNPRGGPSQNLQGYERTSNGNVTVHNTGGQSWGLNSVKHSVESGNDDTHTPACRDLSRYSDNHGMCFCPPREGN